MTTNEDEVQSNESRSARRVLLTGTLDRVLNAAKKTILIISAEQAVNAENNGVTRIAPSN